MKLQAKVTSDTVYFWPIDARVSSLTTALPYPPPLFTPPPNLLPLNAATVKAARAFFQQVNELEKLAKSPKKSDAAAVQRYVAALDILDTYLDLVELPPIDSGHYEQEFDTLVGETARIT